MPALEETYWRAFHNRSPIGEDRADLRAAHIAQTIHNSQSKHGKKLDKFLLFKDSWKRVTGLGAQIRDAFSRFKG